MSVAAELRENTVRETWKLKFFRKCRGDLCAEKCLGDSTSPVQKNKQVNTRSKREETVCMGL